MLVGCASLEVLLLDDNVLGDGFAFGLSALFLGCADNALRLLSMVNTCPEWPPTADSLVWGALVAKSQVSNPHLILISSSPNPHHPH